VFIRTFVRILSEASAPSQVAQPLLCFTTQLTHLDNPDSMKVLLSLIVLFSFAAFAQQVPSAITTDPAPDKASPAAMEELLVPSHGSNLNGLIYIAAGAQPHPTVVLLHGFPGYEQNLDFAQAIRRAGWNVLFFHYRGAWGSPGTFSFSHATEDSQAAVQFLRDARVAKKYRVDPSTIVVIGHSMGGFMAAQTAANDPQIAGAILLAAWNIGLHFQTLTPESESAMRKELFSPEELGPLAGCTGESLFQEGKAHAKDWNLVDLAPKLKSRPVLVVSTNDELRAEDEALAEATRKAGSSQVTLEHMDTDHPFSDHRIALETAVLAWLGQFRK
jgi:uncharacterized protein